MVDPNVGRMIQGTYQLEKQLGAGGAGTVYTALHTKLGSLVAVKFLHSNTDESGSKRFQKEARISATLVHPNIARVYDVGVDEDGSPYLVMEYVDGPNLGELVSKRGGGLSLRRSAALFRQICSAVDAAHAKGIIHRDLKPENVLIANAETQAPLCKVVDFGIALQGDAGTLTRGDVIGTPGYLAPECANHGSSVADARSDVYSLGLMLYETLTGRQALSGEPMEIFEQIIKKTVNIPPITTYRPDLPKEINGVVAKAYALDREYRYASCGELSKAVDELLSLQPATNETMARPTPGGAGATPVEPPAVEMPSSLYAVRSNKWGLRIGIGAIVLLALVTGIYFVVRDDSMSLNSTFTPTVHKKESATVRLQLVGVPRNMKVVDRDHPGTTLPIDQGALVLPRGTHPLHLRFESPSLQPMDIEVIPEADGEINLRTGG
jgi:serine/threonine-protein kinase